MQRISLVEKDQAHPLIRETYQKLEDQGSQVLNLNKVMAHCPHIGLNFQRLGNSILRGEGLSARLRELAVLRVGNLTNAHYELVKHTPIALRAGVSRQQVNDIPDWATSAEFNDQERTVLQYTDEVTQGTGVNDKTFNDLRAFLVEPEIVELTAAIGYYGMVARILNALQIELESQT
ncbi:MAG: carboxymuconolactone decarboxylase family protein [Dehalococcoidales bacterium]|nr:MAG: carboxymuconolactone decarboxylase family protein [Dehalococcoidales bacterium]